MQVVKRSLFLFYLHVLCIGAEREESESANYADSNFGLFTKLICYVHYCLVSNLQIYILEVNKTLFYFLLLKQSHR